MTGTPFDEQPDWTTGLPPAKPPATPVAAAPAATGVAQKMIAPVAMPQAAQPAQQGDQFAQLVRAHESGGNDNASSGIAFGRYQFTKPTWLGLATKHPELGLTPENIYDPAKQDAAMHAVARDYANVLISQGLPPTMPNMFMLHFLGEGGGPAFLKAMAQNPNASAPAIFAKEAQYNPTIFYDKSGAPRTLQQVYGLMTKSFGGDAGSSGAAPQYAASTQAAPATQTPEIPAAALAALGLAPSKAPATEEKQPEIPDAALQALGLTNAVKKGVSPDSLTGAGYTDANGVWHAETKPASAATEKPTFSDLLTKTGEAASSAETVDPAASIEIAKSLAAGAAKDVTGAGELLGSWWDDINLHPDIPAGRDIGEMSARASQYLDTVGNPGIRNFGEFAAPFLLPGGVVSRGKEALTEGGSLAAKVAKEGVWPGIKDALGFTGKETAKGATMGAVIGGIAPTGKEDEGERASEKVGNAGAGALLGALLTGAPNIALQSGKLALDEARRLAQYVKSGVTGEAKAAMEKLRQSVSGKTGEDIEKLKQTESESESAAAVAKLKAEMHEREIEQIRRAQEELKLRQARREAGGDLPPIEAATIRSEAARDAAAATRKAQAEAEKQGLAAEDAKVFAASKSVEETAAKESADKLVEEFQARPAMTREEFGAKLAGAAKADMQALEDTRRLKSGYAAALKADGGQPVIGLRAPLNAVRVLRNKIGATDPALTAELDWLEGAMHTKIGENRYSSLSSENTDRMLRTLQGKIDGLEQAGSSGAKDLEAVRDNIVEILDKQNPKLAEAREKYRALSVDLNELYYDEGAIKKAVASRRYTGTPKVDPTKIVGAILTGGEQSANGLGRLISQDPALKDSALKFFNGQLRNDFPKTPTTEQFNRWMNKYRLPLERAGIKDQFAALGEKIAGAHGAVDTAKKAAADAAERQKAADLVRKQAESKAGARKALEENELSKAKDVETKAKADAESVASQAAATKQRAEATRSGLTRLQSKLEAADPKEAASIAQQEIDALHSNKLISDDYHGEMTKVIKDAQRGIISHEQARRALVRLAVIGAILYGGGQELGQFISHRFTP